MRVIGEPLVAHRTDDTAAYALFLPAMQVSRQGSGTREALGESERLFEPLHGDPRFARLLERLGLSAASGAASR